MNVKKMLTMMIGLIGLNGHAGQPAAFHPVKGFPAHEPGIEQGVSACYAGGLGRWLVMAGGCNFPENTLAPDSKKRYYKGIYVAQSSDGDSLDWKLAGTLPQEMAYGVAVVCDGALIVAGGANDRGSLSSVYRIDIVEGMARTTVLPSLPHAMDNMAGTLVGRHLYVGGGLIGGKATNRVFRMDMDSLGKGWQEVTPFPGLARVQPVAGSVGRGRLAFFGGFEPADGRNPAALAMDGCVYDEQTGEWTSVEGPADDRGESLFVGGGIAVNPGGDSLLVMGGVNKEVFLDAVNRPQPDYLHHPIAWYRFNPFTLLYLDGKWQIVSDSTSTARAGAALARTPHGLYVIGGELKPRVRSNEIYRLATEQHNLY